MLNSQSTGTAGNTNNTQHQVKFEPTVKLAVYTVDYPVYTTESRDRQRRSIRYGEFNIAFIPHHDRITTKNCENSNTLIMNTSTGTDFDSTLLPYPYVFVFYIFVHAKSHRQKIVRWSETKILHRGEVLEMEGKGITFL